MHTHNRSEMDIERAGKLTHVRTNLREIKSQMLKTKKQFIEVDYLEDEESSASVTSGSDLAEYSSEDEANGMCSFLNSLVIDVNEHFCYAPSSISFIVHRFGLTRSRR